MSNMFGGQPIKFGATATPATTANSTGLFGQTLGQTQSSGFVLGQSQPTAAVPSSFTFGATSTPTFGGGPTIGAPQLGSTTSAFGGTSSLQGGNVFGGFGTTPATTTAPPAFNSASGGGWFGQQSIQSTPGSLFATTAPANVVAPSATQQSSFFGSAQPSASIFGQSTLTKPATTTTAPFSFGAVVSQPQTSNIFGGGAGGGFSVPATTAAAPPVAGSLFQPVASIATASTAAATTSSGFPSFNFTAAVNQGATAGLSAATTEPAKATGFAFGITPATPVATVASTTQPAPLSSLFKQPVTSTQAPFAATATVAPIAQPPVTAAPLSFAGALPTASTTAPAAAVSFSAPVSTAAASLPPRTSAPTVTLPATTAVVQPVVTGATMTYSQLEECVNNWMIELEGQERAFLKQATQVNGVDQLLVKNAGNITELNDALERIKLDEQILNHELDFVSSQQKELENSLSVLEQQLAVAESNHANDSQAVNGSGLLNMQREQRIVDQEREKTYKLAENLDSQLHRMADDLKEVIEKVNVASGHKDKNQPINQISKILNAHMDSLQWIEQQTTILQRQLDEAERSVNSNDKRQQRYGTN